MTIYIIEHLEQRMWKWCVIEYKHISKIVGKENLWITNVRKGSTVLEKCGKVIKQSVAELALKKCCVLDPEAAQTLVPEEIGNFDYFIFGGILGDYPPKKRTKKELTTRIKNAEARNIGKAQMSTDNAVTVVKEIADGKSLEELRFKDKLEIPLGKNESTILPYRYLLVNGKPLMSNELVTYLKRKRGF